jgi:hypothetical protein
VKDQHPATKAFKTVGKSPIKRLHLTIIPQRFIAVGVPCRYI